MEITYKLILSAHILSSFTALAAGLLSMMVKKGRGWHANSGLVFYWMMVASTLTGMLMSAYKWNPFLLTIGMFTGYLVYTGKRSLQLKGKDITGKVSKLDWAVWAAFSLSTVWMIGYGLQGNHPLWFVLIVFGIISSLGVREDYRRFKGIAKSDGKDWLRFHIGRMAGAFIAASTAFLANNAHHWDAIPMIVFWLAPTVFLAPLIAYWQRTYTPRKA